MGRLKGKRALITGGTSGIGLETAKAFLNEGAKIIVTGVTPSSIERAKVELGPSVPILAADSLDSNSPNDIANFTKDYFDKLDIVFLNAGISDWRPFKDWDPDSFDRLFQINVKAPFFLMQALVPIMKDPSSVILMGSNSSHDGYATSNAYAASKAAISSLARSWNTDLYKTNGIRFNTISPGPIDTPLYDKLKVGENHLEERLKYIRSGIPAGRFGNAKEIASAVVYLASDESAFNVGIDLIIDGGQSIF